jgi:hypothetical protein
LPDFTFLDRYLFPTYKIHNKHSLEALFSKWNHSVVSAALAFSHDQGDQLEEEIYIARGSIGLIALIDPTDPKANPDWAGIKKALHVEKPHLQHPKSYYNCLPGDSKLSSK